MLPLRIAYELLITLACAAFRIKSNKEQFIAGHCLIHKFSYRLPGKASADPLIGLRVLTRTLAALTVNPAQALKAPSSGLLIFDGKNKNRELRAAYVEWHTGLQAGFIARDQLLYFKGMHGLVMISCLLLLAIPLVITCMLHPRRANLALLLFEYCEACNLMAIIRTVGISKLHFFYPFEKDANFLAMLMMHDGIKVSKHPSPGPVMMHNSLLIADELVCSSQYQVEEHSHFRDTMIVSKLSKWFPEFSLAYIGDYAAGKTQPLQGSIAYYSHASWIRRSSGYHRDPMHVMASEDKLLQELAGFLKSHPNYSLDIFLHPKEKQNGMEARCEHYYGSIFSGLSYKLVKTEGSTAKYFAASDLAVSAFSSIVYERLFCGFKTLVGGYGINNFPLKGSPLNNLVVSKEGELPGKILTALSQEPDDFFVSNKLEDYRYDRFPHYKKLMAGLSTEASKSADYD